MKRHHVEDLKQALSALRGHSISISSDGLLSCDGVKLRLALGFLAAPSEAGLITLYKDPEFLLEYLRELKGMKVENVLEMGLWDGGSAIFFWNLFKPKKFLGMDINDSMPFLESYVEKRRLKQSFKFVPSLNQLDKESVSDAINAEFGSDLIDLIIDDASHLYHPSKCFFETAFSHLREGGFYILEDWRSHLFFEAIGSVNSEEPPLHLFVHELIDYSLKNPNVIRSIKVLSNFVVIERGKDTIKNKKFSITA